jgi:hypothetical protein
VRQTLPRADVRAHLSRQERVVTAAAQVPPRLRGPEPVPTFATLAAMDSQRGRRPSRLAACTVCGEAFSPRLSRLETCSDWCDDTLGRWRAVAAAAFACYWQEIVP